MEEESRRNHRGEPMKKESWRRSHGGGIMEKESWRNRGGGIDESWRRNHGGDATLAKQEFIAPRSKAEETKFPCTKQPTQTSKRLSNIGHASMNFTIGVTAMTRHKRLRYTSIYIYIYI